jgi:hypothetical protein
LLREHAGLLIVGIGLGATAGIVAALPSLQSSGGRAPWLVIAGLIASVAIAGLIALRWAIGANLNPVIRQTLQNE